MSLIKRIKQFINGTWQEFSLSSEALDNVVDLNSDQIIRGEKSFGSRAYFNQGLEVHRETTIQIGDVSIGKDDDGLLYTTGDNGGKIATQEWVNGVITGKVDYLGTVASQQDLFNLAEQSNSTAGDYCRASAEFNLYDSTLPDNIGEKIHIGDILIYKAGSTISGVPSAANWDVIHTEDPGNYASLEGHNVFNGYNTFNGGVEINCDYSSHANSKTKGFSVNVNVGDTKQGLMLNPGGLLIGDWGDNTGYINIDPTNTNGQLCYTTQSSDLDGPPIRNFSYTLPEKSGTFALLSDIPTNYVTTDTDQMISGGKTFNIHTHMNFTDRTRFEVHHTAESGMGLFDYTFACGAYWPYIQGNGKGMYISSTGFQRDDDAGSSTWFTLPTESLDPATHDLTLATRGWVKANAIGSSTIDQEFFNSLY